MVKRVVISHNQTEYIHKFPKSDIVFIFDNITTADIDMCQSVPYVQMNTMGNRSLNRNAGLSYWMNHGLEPNTILEFYDGDRYPIVYQDPSHEMNKYDADILLYMCSIDSRQGKVSPGTLLNTGGGSNPFYSCGFAIKYSAVLKILEFNHGPFFRTEFNGWGAEDQYMGLVANKLKLQTYISESTILNGKVGFDIESHPEHLETMITYYDLAKANDLI